MLWGRWGRQQGDPGHPWAGAAPGAVVVPRLWLQPVSGVQAVVLVPFCLFLPSSQGFFTVTESELLFSFSGFVFILEGRAVASQ